MDKKYILYIHTRCQFCKKAISLLRERDENFTTLDLSSRPKVLQELKHIYEWNTVPMVFHKDGNQIEFIGGFSDLQERLSDG